MENRFEVSERKLPELAWSDDFLPTSADIAVPGSIAGIEKNVNAEKALFYWDC
jgi:hypothetical protein